MSNTSVRSYGTDYIDHVGVTENTPFENVALRDDLLAAWKQNAEKTLFTPINRPTGPLVHVVDGPTSCFAASMTEAFMEQRKLSEESYKLRERKFRAFGTFGMDEDEKKLFVQCGEGLETLEEQLPAINYAIEKVRSRKAWKVEQNRHRQPSHYGDTDGMSFELPPLDAPHCKIITRLNRKLKIPMRMKQAATKLGHGVVVINFPKTHTPAIYQLKPKDGEPVVLDELSDCGPEGMRRLAKKLGFEPRGGDTETLNLMMGTEKVEWTDSHGSVKTAWPWLATYSSKLTDGQWLVTVARKRNPVCTPSSYWATELGELTRENPNRYTDKDTGETCFLEPGHADYTAPLTLSELDYKLLSESSELEVQDDNGETVSYMNEEEEFLTCFPLREDGSDFIDFSKYCEDDDEMSLFNECSKSLERSETGITLGELESQQFLMHIKSSLDEAQARLDESMANVVTESDITDEDREDMKTVRKFKRLDTLWNHYVGNSKTDHLVSYWMRNDRNRMMCMSKLNHAKGIPAVIPGAELEPRNTIAAPPVREVDVMPEHRTVDFTWLSALSPALMERRERQNRKAHAIASANNGTLRAQLAFSAALETALTAALRA